MLIQKPLLMITSTGEASRVWGVAGPSIPMRNFPGGHQQKTMPRLLIHSSPGLGLLGGSLLVETLRLREGVMEVDLSLGNENPVQICCFPPDLAATLVHTACLASPSGRSLTSR